MEMASLDVMPVVFLMSLLSLSTMMEAWRWRGRQGAASDIWGLDGPWQQSTRDSGRITLAILAGGRRRHGPISYSHSHRQAGSLLLHCLGGGAAVTQDASNLTPSSVSRCSPRPFCRPPSTAAFQHASRAIRSMVARRTTLLREWRHDQRRHTHASAVAAIRVLHRDASGANTSTAAPTQIHAQGTAQAGSCDPRDVTACTQGTSLWIGAYCILCGRQGEESWKR